MTHVAAVSGVGYSDVTRGGCPDPRVLAVDACRAALADAGISGTDIDGIFEYRIGPDSPPVLYVQQALGIPNLEAYADLMPTGPSGLASALIAAMAVQSGTCETALVYRCFTQRTATMSGPRTDLTDPSNLTSEFLAPYGVSSTFAAYNVALKMQRRTAELGGRPEDYGYVSVNARRWASLNERALLRDVITLDDYFDSRSLVTPLRLYDCDYPVNGACAAVITTAERARAGSAPPICIESTAFGTGGDFDWLYAGHFLDGGMSDCARMLWRRSEYTADDIDIAGLYDGFTYSTVAWTEALGFCGPGEFNDWVEKGRRIGPGGELPLNTSGGHLAEGRLHGLSLLTEAVLQLRGECGARQVNDAQVALVSSGLGSQTGALILHRT